MKARKTRLSRVRHSPSKMLKKSASGVLASLRGSTYRSVRLASKLATALLDSLFEHPAWRTPVILNAQISAIQVCQQSFSAACWLWRTERDEFERNATH